MTTNQLTITHRTKCNNAIKTKDVFPRFFDADKTGDVFQGEKYRDAPFQGQEQSMVLLVNLLNAFQHHQDHTDDDQEEQYNVEQFSRRGVRFIDDFMKFALPSAMWPICFHGFGFSAMVFGALLFLKKDWMMKVVFSSPDIGVIIDSKIGILLI